MKKITKMGSTTKKGGPLTYSVITWSPYTHKSTNKQKQTNRHTENPAILKYLINLSHGYKETFFFFIDLEKSNNRQHKNKLNANTINIYAPLNKIMKKHP